MILTVKTNGRVREEYLYKVGEESERKRKKKKKKKKEIDECEPGLKR